MNDAQGQTTALTGGNAAGSADAGKGAAGGEAGAADKGNVQALGQENAGSVGDAAKQAAEKIAADKAAVLELKLPDGFKADDKLLGDFKTAAKELGLKSDGAQKIADLFFASQKSAAEASKKQADAAQLAADQELKGWAESLKTNKEFGGAQLDANLKIAQRPLTKFGSPALKDILNKTGLGDHPEVVGFFYRLGKTMAEDSIGGANGAATKTPRNDDGALFDAMYPTMAKQS